MELNNFKSFKTGSRRVSKSSVGSNANWINDGGIGEPDIAPARTINQSFLESLVGLPSDDTAEMVKEKGFEPMVIEYGHGIATMLMPDVIYLWQGADGYSVERASCGDTSQVVQDV